MADQFPTQPGQTVYIHPQQMQGFIDAVNQLNDAVGRISGAVGQKGGQFRTVEEGTGGEEGVVTAARQETAQQYLIQTRMKQLVEQGVDQRIDELKKMFKSDKIPLPSGPIAITKQSAGMVGQKGELGDQINEVILKKFQQVVNQEGPGRFTSIMNAIQESGLKQLRFGELPPQQILQGTGELLKRYSTYRMSQGKSGAALGELGNFLGGAGDVLGPATIIAEEAKAAYDKGMGNYRALTTSGQLTGQGTMAGFEAKYLSPMKIFNPFGRIGWGTAGEIVQNTREQGFTGQQAGQVEQGMAQVVSNLGIQVGQATEFFTQSMREGGMSVGQVTQEMNTFHDATRNLNMNINDYTEQIMTSTETLRDSGAGTAAPGLAQQITAALPRAYRTAEGTSFLTGAFQKSKGVLAAMVGHGATYLNIGSQQYARAGYSALDTLLGQEVQRAKYQGIGTTGSPEERLNAIATYLSETSPYFQGENVNQLQQYINRVQHGRGIGAQMTISRAANVMHQRIAAASVKKVRYSELTNADAQAKGLTAVFNAAGTWTGYRNRAGKFFSLHDFTTTTGDYYTGSIAKNFLNDRGVTHVGQILHSGPGNMGTFSTAQERKAKEEFLRAAKKSGFLTSAQMTELRKAKPFDVQSTLATIMQAQSGKKVTVGTQVGSITVELGKQAQGLLTLVKERQNAVANGTVQANNTGG